MQSIFQKRYWYCDFFKISIDIAWSICWPYNATNTSILIFLDQYIGNSKVTIRNWYSYNNLLEKYIDKILYIAFNNSILILLGQDIAYQYIGNILPPIIRYWCWSAIILLDQYNKYMPTIFQYLYCSSNTLPSIFQYWYNNFLKSKTLYSFCQYQCIVATCNMLLST